MSNLLYRLLIKNPTPAPLRSGTRPDPTGEGICAPIVGRDLLAKKAKRNLYEKTLFPGKLAHEEDDTRGCLTDDIDEGAVGVEDGFGVFLGS